MWLFDIFKKKKELTVFEKTVTITRSGFDIIIPEITYNRLVQLGYYFGLVKYKGKPSCVQLSILSGGKSIYRGTLKSWLKVKEFKDGNVCNFSNDNIITE